MNNTINQKIRTAIRDLTVSIRPGDQRIRDFHKLFDPVTIPLFEIQKSLR